MVYLCVCRPTKNDSTGNTPVRQTITDIFRSWWRHQMEVVSALLAICAGNSPVPGEFPAQRPVTRGFDVFFDLRPNKRLSKQSRGWWFETSSRPLWRHRNVFFLLLMTFEHGTVYALFIWYWLIGNIILFCNLKALMFGDIKERPRARLSGIKRKIMLPHV